MFMLHVRKQISIRACIERRKAAIVTKEPHDHRISSGKHISSMCGEGDLSGKICTSLSCFCCKKDASPLPRSVSDIRLAVSGSWQRGSLKRMPVFSLSIHPLKKHIADDPEDFVTSIWL